LFIILYKVGSEIEVSQTQSEKEVWGGMNKNTNNVQLPVLTPHVQALICGLDFE
jgi:hypothetical protein